MGAYHQLRRKRSIKISLILFILAVRFYQIRRQVVVGLEHLSFLHVPASPDLTDREIIDKEVQWAVTAAYKHGHDGDAIRKLNFESLYEQLPLEVGIEARIETGLVLSTEPQKHPFLRGKG